MDQPIPSGWISQAEFSDAVKALPLVSIDLVVVNSSCEMLLGRRVNRPAQGCWFTPGCRVRKNETLECVLQRVWQEELGQTSTLNAPLLLGAWEHIYPDSAFDERISTHYVNLPHLVLLSNQTAWDWQLVPSDQHDQWRWMALSQVTNNASVHAYVRPYALEASRHLEKSFNI